MIESMIDLCIVKNKNSYIDAVCCTEDITREEPLDHTTIVFVYNLDFD